MDTKLLKQKILDLAIRGKLVPQDPNDEPASVLLERIRAEREKLIAEGKLKRSKKTSENRHYENVPFEVPESWEWAKLEDVTECIVDCPHSTAKDEGCGFPLIRTPNIGEGYLLLDGVHRVSKTVYNKRNLRATPETGDIIYAREAPAGNAAVINIDEKVCLGQRTVLIRPLKKYLLPQLLAFFIIAPSSKNRLVSTAVGSTATHVNLENIRPFEIPLPPFAEQKRIIIAIENWLALINRLENDKQDLKKIIKYAKSKVLDLAIHGKLVKQDPDDEPASELLRRIAPNAVPCDTFYYPKLPKGWVVCRLEDIVNYEQPSQYIVGLTNYNDEFETPVLTAGKSFILGYTNETNGVYDKLPAIIFDDFTTDSRLVGFPFKVKSSAIKILQVHKEINIKYVAYFMSITRLVGDTHKRYWISEYSKIPIPLPPVNEQNRIVQAILKIEEKVQAICAEL